MTLTLESKIITLYTDQFIDKITDCNGEECRISKPSNTTQQ
jgi:hypothetical protein